MDSSIVFAGLRQCTPSPNTCFLGPTGAHTPNGYRSVQPFLNRSRQKVPTLYNGPPLSRQNCRCAWKSCTPSNTCFVRPTLLSITDGISIGSAVFAGLTAECHYTLQWAAPFALEIAPFNGYLDPHLIRDFLSPREPTTQTASRSLQAFNLCRAYDCDKPTD